MLHGKILLRCRGDHWSPANLPQQRIFRDSFLQGKRARASNARPYKSFSTAWGPHICGPAVYGKRALMGNPRAGHARPLPRGS